MENLTYQELSTIFKTASLDDFLCQIGTGDISTVDVVEKVLAVGRVEEAPKTLVEEMLPTQEAPQRPATVSDGVTVQGTGNMLTVLARCCNPMPPDEIIGFVTAGAASRCTGAIAPTC